MITRDYSTFRAEIDARSDAATLMSVRHEMFFVGVKRSRIGQALHCALAAARDVWWMFARLRRSGRSSPVPDFAFIASLGGANGWKALLPELERLRGSGCECVVYVHPRLRHLPHSHLPRRPPARIFWAALVAALHAPAPPLGFDRVALGFLLFRAALWSGAWRETFAKDGLARRAIVVHNDFDMFLRPAVSTAQEAGRDAICLQHGVPTAEFFPLTAHRHLVWSEHLAHIYRSHGGVAARIEVMSDRPSLPPRSADRQVDPVVRFISQTHTTIYGRDLGTRMIAFVKEAAKAFSPNDFRVLIHPNEVKRVDLWHKGAPGVQLEKPPHRSFAHSSEDVRIFIGFSSTALMEVAVHGHLAISIDLPHTDSRAARDVLRLPLTLAADSVVDVVRKLLSDARLREATLDAQDLWLMNTLGWRN